MLNARSAITSFFQKVSLDLCHAVIADQNSSVKKILWRQKNKMNEKKIKKVEVIERIKNVWGFGMSIMAGVIVIFLILSEIIIIPNAILLLIGFEFLILGCVILKINKIKDEYIKP